MKEQRAKIRNGIVERVSRAQLTPEEDHIRKAILKAFAREGKAPSIEEVAQTLGFPSAFVREVCRRLAAHDLIVWKDDGVMQKTPTGDIKRQSFGQRDGGNHSGYPRDGQSIFPWVVTAALIAQIPANCQQKLADEPCVVTLHFSPLKAY